VVGRQVLELIDLGAELHGILTMPEFMGLKPEEVPTYEDSAGLQVAIDTANLFRECSPSDLLEFADSAPMKLDEEDPAMANMITMMTLTIHNNAPLSPRMVQKVKAGAAAMRAMERHAWRRHGGRVA
jgi:hypothetical protein